MFKNTLLRIAIPIVCALSVAFTPLEVSAAHYSNYNNDGCSDPCHDQCTNKRSWLKDAAIFVGAAAIGAIAGVAAANSNGRGKRGATGPQGAQGVPGTPGAQGVPGAGFTAAVSPPGQPDAGFPITSLIFTFITDVPFSVAGGSFQAYVTTPDGRTFLGTSNTFNGLLNSQSTVTIPTGPFLAGNYDVGVIAPTGTTTIAGLVKMRITSINGFGVVSNLDQAGILIPATVVSGTDAFFNAQYPIPPLATP